MAELEPTSRGSQMERRVIPARSTTVFEFDYSVQAEDMRGSLREGQARPVERAPATSPWDTPEPSDGRALADELVDIHGSPIWAKLSREGPRGAEPAHRGLAALGAGLRRAGRAPRVQPARQHRHRAPTRSSSRPPRSWTRRGTTRCLERYIQTPARRAPLPDAGQRAGALRRDPHRLPLVHQDHRAPAGGRDLRGRHVQDDGRVRPRIPLLRAGLHAASCRTSRAHMGFGMLALPGVDPRGERRRAPRDGGLHLPRPREGA